MRKGKWLSRHDNGRHFRVGEKAHLPPHKWKDGAKLVKPQVKTLKISELKFREDKPVDLEPRVRYFMELIKANYPIAPITVQRQKDGTMLVIDGHARTEAFRRTGSTEIQATVTHPKKMKLQRIVER